MAARAVRVTVMRGPLRVAVGVPVRMAVRVAEGVDGVAVASGAVAVRVLAHRTSRDLRPRADGSATIMAGSRGVTNAARSVSAGGHAVQKGGASGCCACGGATAARVAA